MKLKPIICSLFAASAMFPVAHAQTAAPLADAEQAIPATITSNQLTSEVEGLVAQLNAANRGSWFGYSIVTVEGSHSHPDWGKQRVLAFQRAMADIENNYIQFSGQQIASERLTEYFSDNAFEAEEFDWSASGNDAAWRRMFNKAVALTEAQLDNLLRESGVSPQDFDQMTAEQKQIEFRDSIQREVSRESFGNLAGMITVRTYEGFDEDGNYKVAVVSGVSENMKQLAYQIQHSRGDIAPSSDRRDTLTPILSRTAEQMVMDYGIRRLYDENGYPVLVSFGQWAVSYQGEDSRRVDRHRDAAYRQAEIQADAALAEFIRSRATYADSSEIASVYEESTTVDENNQFSAQAGSSITDIIRESSSRNTNINVTGIANLRRWHTQHPQNPDQLIVGVVRYWSPVNETNAREIQGWTPDRTNPAASSAPAAPEEDKTPPPTSTIEGSDILMDIDDF